MAEAEDFIILSLSNVRVSLTLAMKNGSRISRFCKNETMKELHVRYKEANELTKKKLNCDGETRISPEMPLVMFVVL